VDVKADILDQQFATHGYAVIPDVVMESCCEAISAALRDCSDVRVGGRSRTGLLEPWCRDLAIFIRRHAALSGMVAGGSVAVQCTLFEKSPENNWLVSLHQDLSIPVRERIPENELSGWSVKEGRVFVQPPTSVLESLVAIRVHLDDCGPETGGLRVVPRSHLFGRLDIARASALRDEYGETAPTVRRGGVLAMRPLLLHASSKSAGLAFRRVLHFVFGPPKLPSGLVWADSV
jgi:Phytanoyl-CoA dioxygenase (PhyH)